MPKDAIDATPILLPIFLVMAGLVILLLVAFWKLWKNHRDLQKIREERTKLIRDWVRRSR